MEDKFVYATFQNVRDDKKQVRFKVMEAMQAWEFRHQFRAFLASDDAAGKKEFVSRVFSLIEVETLPGSFIPLITSAMISNHLGTGEAAQAILSECFDGFLDANGIDRVWCAEQLTYTKNVGTKAAHVFLASTLPRLLSGEFLGV
jgi:hypothetical protein